MAVETSTRDAFSRPIGGLAFAGFALASFGGPLALAAQGAPGALSDAGGSAGLVLLLGIGVFIAPLTIWLRYSAQVSGAGGLYGFVEAAAGRPVARVQAAIWTVSYLLYLVYTTVQIVYDVLPAALPVTRSYQTILALVIPIALACVMTAGRAVALGVIGLIAASQLVLGGILDAIALSHVSTSASSFGVDAHAGPIAKASVQTSLLYICGSLPLFLGGEVTAPRRTIRRGLLGTFTVSGLIIVLAVVPMATLPGLLQTDVPGFRLAQQFASSGVATAIGIGVAVSIAGVMFCEYFALSRLLHSITSWRLRGINLPIGAVIVLAAPLSLIDPGGFYDALIKPSLIALWLSQLIVFAVYPRLARRQRRGMKLACALSFGASGMAVYGLWTSLQVASS